MDDGGVRRSVWWWVAGAAFVITVGAVLAYLAFQPDQTLTRANELGSVGSVITGAAGLLVTIASLRIATSHQDRQSPGKAISSRKVWNAPIRNRMFLGRDQVLDAMRNRLQDDGTAVVQALHGMGGVGKTQLAIEYAHRFSAEYDLVWWFAAEKPELISDQYLTLAIEAGLVSHDEDTKTAVGRVKAYLHERSRWLLLFDNAEDPAQLVPWLPVGTGHVVITSRNPEWGEVAAPVSVDVFSRDESISLLRARLPHLTDDHADRLAVALGDLPLALAQAAGTIAETGMTAAEYEAALAAKASQVLAESPPPTYPLPLAAAVRVSADRLAVEEPTSAFLLQLCAWLAPEPIPVRLLVNVGESQLAVHLAIGRIARLGLARVDSSGELQFHRLTQAILRDSAAPDTRTRVEDLLVAAGPENGSDPQYWPTWAWLVAHILALDPAESNSTPMRDLACNMVWYLLNRGDTRTARDLAAHFRERWLARYGADDQAVLWASNHLAQAYRDLGDYEKARPLDEEVYARYRTIHGDDHVYTLTSANNLANILRHLGEISAARDLHEDTFNRRRQVLGDNHPNTLTSANNLADILRELGELQAARDLHQDTLSRRRQALGDNHLRTLRTANSLAEDLWELGELQAARDLHQDTLSRRRQALGDDHSDTLESASNLALTLRALGETKVAIKLEKETAVRRRRLALEHAVSSDRGASPAVISSTFSPHPR
jgi:tetratricopeptide (TPR) repeat protein